MVLQSVWLGHGVSVGVVHLYPSSALYGERRPHFVTIALRGLPYHAN